MDEHSLAVLGRNATLGQTKDALRLVKSMRSATGFDLNVDVMTCIPGQSLAEAVSDIDRIVDFINPEHLSVYCLTVEEGTPLAADVAAGRVREMETDRQADMLFEIWHHLASLGYDHYEVSNFARRDQDSHSAYITCAIEFATVPRHRPSACSTALAPDGWSGATPSPMCTPMQHNRLFHLPSRKAYQIRGT
jgi:coproporphyrinogen III oxidase-like Fe-S oxidoreductase